MIGDGNSLKLGCLTFTRIRTQERRAAKPICLKVGKLGTPGCLEQVDPIAHLIYKGIKLGR